MFRIKTRLEIIVHISLIIAVFVKFGALPGFLYILFGHFISLIVSDFVGIILVFLLMVIYKILK